MQMTIEVPEQDLLDFGRQAIQEEMQSTLKWLHMRRRFEQISTELKASFQEPDYLNTTEQIRSEAWQEYKQSLGL